MPSVRFTSNLERHLSCPMAEVEAHTVRDALHLVFESNPKLEGYILDDQERLRKHVTIFIDNTMIKDRLNLSDAVKPHSEIYVLQALSGG